MSVCDLLMVVVHRCCYTRLLCSAVLGQYVSMLCQWPSAQKQISLCLGYLLGVCVLVLGMSYGRHVYVGVKTLSIAALDGGGS